MGGWASGWEGWLVVGIVGGRVGWWMGGWASGWEGWLVDGWLG